MSKFELELPSDLLSSLNDLEVVAPKMMGEMTKAGAEEVADIVKNNLSRAFSSTDGLADCLYVTKTYQTPSDDGINNKVGIYGYFINNKGKKVPAPLVAQAREYGTSTGEAKKPFFRKAFNKSKIESSMMQVQNDYVPKE